MDREVKVVIVNGYNLDAPDWHYVMWGDTEKGQLGRVPMALYVAAREEADFILWNTGASKGQWGKEELFEGEMTYRLARTFVESLYHDFPNYFDTATDAFVRTLLRDVTKHRSEHVSKKTLGSAVHAVAILDELIGEKPAHVISVSSANHTRAGHHFQMVLQHGYRGHGPLKSRALRVSHVCAHTGYNGGGIEQVKILECTGEDQYVSQL